MGQANLPKPETVLLVDDEVLFRMEQADMLEDFGLTVFEANNADEAIALLDSHPEIGILMTDIDMPGSMDGIKLAHHVRDRWPPVKLLVMSGNSSIQPSRLPLETIFLRKPFASDPLRGALATLFN